MGKLMEKFDKLSDDEKTNISILIHGNDNIIELDDKLIFDNHSEPMDESEYLQLSNIVSKYYDDNEWELIHCNLSSKFKNTRVIDSQYTRTYNHVKNSLNWDFIPYNVDDLKHKREKVFLFYNGFFGVPLGLTW